MLLNVSAALQAPGAEIPFAMSEEMPPTTWDGAELFFESPVEVRGTCVAVKEDVWVRATVRAQVRTACGNCLGDARHDACAALEVRFTRDPDPDDPDLFPFEGHALEMDDAVLGALWLEMPMRILCKPDCQGICPVCGANRNETRCACQKEMPSKHPFSALASLLNQDEEV